ncbi:hypothetical protein GGR60_001601 [Xanthomonas arboricola]|uniref:hypothetical protein n=1 Tax=Xanthomonas euroxanthea TaxID=2259622 RepID=UPI0014307FC4|nr:hypothetical protein [Xanthomonas euroxanthea]NJC37066.1 hypothetical protein [Xanthomonas euroxanthea]
MLRAVNCKRPIASASRSKDRWSQAIFGLRVSGTSADDLRLVAAATDHQSTGPAVMSGTAWRGSAPKPDFVMVFGSTSPQHARPHKHRTR